MTEEVLRGETPHDPPEVDVKMIKRLTIKDLNCGNCTVRECGFNPECIADRSPLFKVRSEAVLWFTSIWGCARHPLALQVLAAPIIEALNRQANNLGNREPRFGTRMENESLSCGYAEAEGMREAIKLLMGGAKEQSGSPSGAEPLDKTGKKKGG